jgi:uncharacterized protein (TIGR00251 family)
MAAESDRGKLTVRVTPNARRSEFVGWVLDEKQRPVLQVKLQAPPVEGKANAELIRFISKELGCAKNEVSLLRGDTQRVKSLEIPAHCLSSLPPMDGHMV